MICFDFDGVLADSLSAWEEACSHAARQMGASAPLHPYAKLNPLSHYEVGKSLGLEPRTFEHLASEFFITQKLDSIIPALLLFIKSRAHLTNVSKAHISPQSIKL